MNRKPLALINIKFNKLLVCLHSDVGLSLVVIGCFLQHQRFGPNASSISRISFSFPESVMSSGGAAHPLAVTARALIVSLWEKWSRTRTIGHLQSSCLTVRTADCVSKNGLHTVRVNERTNEKTKPNEEVFSCNYFSHRLQEQMIRKMTCKCEYINIFEYILIFFININ